MPPSAPPIMAKPGSVVNKNFLVGVMKKPHMIKPKTHVGPNTHHKNFKLPEGLLQKIINEKLKENSWRQMYNVKTD